MILVRVPYISTYILGSERGWEHPALFFSPFLSTEGGAGERVFLAATAVSSCEASTVLEEPLKRSGKKLLGERKNEPTSMRSASDDLPPVSIHGAICMYTGVAGHRVVMW